MKKEDIKKLTDRLDRVEYELTELRFRCKELECKQDPGHADWYERNSFPVFKNPDI